MFLVARLILGAGIPFCISGASQLIAELTYPKEAGILNGLFNESWVSHLRSLPHHSSQNGNL